MLYEETTVRKALPFITLAVLAALFFGAFLYGRGSGEKTIRARVQAILQENNLLGAVKYRYLSALETEKSAVMADTDELSAEFAQEARLHAEKLDQALQALHGSYQARQAVAETHALLAFGECWEEIRKLDENILTLAVQNTNLKAGRLSHGVAISSLRDLDAALARLIFAERENPEVESLRRHAERIQLAAWRIQALHFPHVDESEIGRMSEIEKEASGLRHEAKGVMESMWFQVSPEGRPHMSSAQAAFSRHAEFTTEIFALSRENSNLISLRLSLGQKRKLAATCGDRLQVLVELNQSPQFKATR